MYLYCVTDRRENPFAALPLSPKGALNTGAAKDWNDSRTRRVTPQLIDN